MIKIVGIDPGLAETGVGIVCGSGMKVTSFAYGVITTEKRLPVEQRLECIFSRITEVLEQHRPEQMVVEAVFSLARNPRSGITLAKAAGVILLAGSRAGIPVMEIPVREAKQVLTGNGQSSKSQLELAVRHNLGHTAPIRPDHGSDALALALIGLYRFRAPEKIDVGIRA